MSDDANDEPANDDEPRFEEDLDALRAALADLEGGRLGLEDSLARFEAGVGLLKRCRATLDRAERRVELLTGVTEDGEPVTAPFDASPTGDQGGAGRRAAGGESKRGGHARNRKRDDADGAPSAGLF